MILNLFHRHAWEISHVQFTPPMRFDQLKITGTRMPPEVLQQVTLGVTVVIERCDGCGKVKPHHIIGRAYQEDTE